MIKNKNVVLLASYLPPPTGGIATWTSTILQEAEAHPDIKIITVNIAPRLRMVHEREIWRRVMAGGIQLLQDFFMTLSEIKKGRPATIHLCSHGQLAVFRDITFLLLSSLYGMKKIYHLRFGRLAELSQKKTGNGD